MSGETAHRSEVVCIGPSHRTAGLAVRERFALVAGRGRELCEALSASEHVHEVVAVATCNRSELYLVLDDPETRLGAVVEAMLQWAGAEPADAAALAVRREADAIEHLLRVAGGIESVVVGEAQIQGQLRDAHAQAQDAGTCGPLLDRAFRMAVETGRRARRETSIGEGRASIGSVAAELVAGQLHVPIERANVVVVGAGKMGALAARSLADRGVRGVDVANRTLDRAERVAGECGGAGVPLESLDDELVRCDVVVTSTDAPHHVVTAERVRAALASRDERPLVLVDLAVPRDVDPACAELEGVRLFDLDDLERVVSETLTIRSGAVGEVAAMAADGAAEFTSWRRGRQAGPEIAQMRDEAHAARRELVERFARRNPDLDAATLADVEELARTLVNRALHAPTTRLRARAEQGELRQRELRETVLERR